LLKFQTLLQLSAIYGFDEGTLRTGPAGMNPGREDLVSRSRRFARWLWLSTLAALGFCFLFLGGFAVFSTHVSRLATPSDPASADAIIVLTGGQARLDAAIDLLKSGKGERLLISGVHPDANRDDLSAVTGGDKSLFSCCVDIDHAALDTIGNAEESAKWVRTHDYSKVILVTNNYHMPRSLLEMGRLLGTAELEPYPVVNTRLDDGRWLQPEALRVLFTEYNKYLLALARGVVPLRPTANGLAIVSAKAAAD
jgi:uncharacterized SAM-binding protein YcdF (DUF218 family)